MVWEQVLDVSPTTAANGSFPGLVAVIQTILSARELDDVRDAVAHGVRRISRYSSLALYEQRDEGTLELTLRQGVEPGAAGTMVEALLVALGSKAGRTVSTLDRLADRGEQSLTDGYADGGRLCLCRPLYAYGEFVGMLALHYEGRSALAEGEFDALRRFADCVGVALASARLRDELAGYAYSDPLTGLANRRRLEDEFSRLRGSQLSLLLIDFDGLKAVNDALGFESGDRLINAIGVALASLAAPPEVVARLGGDEFVVVLPNVDAPRARTRAEELTAVLDDLSLPADLAPLFRGASVGWATAEANEEPSDVLLRAAAEMRSRKRRRKTDSDLLGGRNLV